MLPNISPKNKKKLEQEVARCCKIAKERFGVDLKPKIIYSHPSFKQRHAGMAIYESSTLVYNPWFLENQTNEFIDRTVPHEVAHLVVRSLQEGNKAGWKIDPHGPVFRKVMTAFGVPATQRTEKHDYDISVLPDYQSKFIYQCVKCQHIHALGKPNHAAMLTNPQRYSCVKCNNEIKLLKSAIV
jgi:SprT protein